MPNKENIAKWVAALRSGEYRQAKKQLRTAEGYCCLGVACDVFRKETGQGEWGTGHSFLVPVGTSSTSHLPSKVSGWLGVGGIQCITPEVHDETGVLRTLTYFNDIQDASFSRIADLIEAEWLRDAPPKGGPRA